MSPQPAGTGPLVGPLVVTGSAGQLGARAIPLTSTESSSVTHGERYRHFPTASVEPGRLRFGRHSPKLGSWLAPVTWERRSGSSERAVWEEGDVEGAPIVFYFEFAADAVCSVKLSWPGAERSRYTAASRRETWEAQGGKHQAETPQMAAYRAQFGGLAEGPRHDWDDDYPRGVDQPRRVRASLGRCPGPFGLGGTARESIVALSGIYNFRAGSLQLDSPVQAASAGKSEGWRRPNGGCRSHGPRRRCLHDRSGG